jgi:predicted Zn finger-like uncharacterized protein
MIIACPHCSTGYMLPENLMGPGGARVRCPRCQQVFAVGRDGRAKAAASSPPVTPLAPEPALEVKEELPASSQAAPAAPAASPTGVEPLAVARAVLAELAAREGEALEQARAEQRLFAAFGPALMEAYEAYRRRAGQDADPSAFREALRERWGVELLPLAGREG